MTLAKAEAAQIVLARESTLGTAATTGFVQVQPNPGGIQDWHPDLVTVERDPLSKYASREKGDHVGLNATPKLVHDLNKDWLDIHAELIFRSAGKHNGGSGTAFFRPTAIVDGGGSADSFSVASGGAVPSGTLLYARGWTTPANNAVWVATTGSDATNVKVPTASLTAEASNPGNATLEVVGVQGTSGDIQLDASGNLTASTLDFTTLGLQVGQWIAIPTTAVGTSHTFATAAYQGGKARIVTIAAGKLTLERRTWTVGSADTGSGKTIWLLFGRWYRNVALDHADYLEPSLTGELTDVGPGAGNTSTYTYAYGMSLKTFEIDAPIESKILTTATYCGTNIAAPVLAADRISGPSLAYAPLASALVDTALDIGRARLADAADEDSLIAELNSCKITIENNCEPRKQLGTFGAAGMSYGKFEPMAAFEAYFLKAESITAIRDNRDCSFDFIASNGQFGFVFDMPLVALRGGAKSYAANKPVMLSATVPGFRDPDTNIVASLTVFPYLA